MDGSDVIFVCIYIVNLNLPLYAICVSSDKYCGCTERVDAFVHLRYHIQVKFCYGVKSTIVYAKLKYSILLRGKESCCSPLLLYVFYYFLAQHCSILNFSSFLFFGLVRHGAIWNFCKFSSTSLIWYLSMPVRPWRPFHFHLNSVYEWSNPARYVKYFPERKQYVVGLALNAMFLRFGFTYVASPAIACFQWAYIACPRCLDEVQQMSQRKVYLPWKSQLRELFDIWTRQREKRLEKVRIVWLPFA